MSKSPQRRQNQTAKNPNILPSDNQIGEQLIYLQETRGPLPDPETLKQYQAIDPNIVTDFMSSYKEEGKHRRHIQARVVTSQSIAYLINNVTFIIIAAAILYVGYLFMDRGYATQGASIICTTLVSSAGIIITRSNILKSNSKKKESE